MPQYTGTGIPYFDVAWAADGILATIPDAPASDGSASYTQGWTTPYELPSTNPAYLPVPLNYSNKVLNDITSLLQYIGQNGAPPFITTAMNGGINPFSYNLGAIVSFNAGLGTQNWVSAVPANTTIPGSSSNWIALPTSRVTLAANATYYISTAGNDSTGNGTSGNPWLTRQQAYNYVQQYIDLAGYSVTFSVANGTYTDVFNPQGPLVGQADAGSVVFQGNAGSPSSCIINVGANNACFSANSPGCNYTVNGFTLESSGSGSVGLESRFGGGISYSNVVFGTFASGNHLTTGDQASLTATGNYSINGGALTHFDSYRQGQINCSNVTITISGTPAFGTAFATAADLALLWAASITFSGSATGPRYATVTNAVIETSGGGANYFPGNSAGTTASGGQYA